MLHPVQAAGRTRTILLTLMAGAAFFAAGTSQGQDGGRVDGLFLTVPDPIKGETVDVLRRKILDAVGRQKRTIKTIVFDFNPNDLPAETRSFGTCVDLAQFIRKLQLGGDSQLPRVATIAFVHKAVTNHSVLPVLACSQIVYGPDGSLGAVPREELNIPAVRAAYDEQAKYHVSPALARRTYDADVVLKRVKIKNGESIVDEATFERWKKEGKDVSLSPNELRDLEPGRSLVNREAASDSGLATAVLPSRAAVAEAIGLSRRSLTEDWLIDRTPVAWRIEVRGHLDAGKIESLGRRIKHAVGQNANVVILHLDSVQGDIRTVAGLAEEIRTLKDNSGQHPVRTVAWIPPQRHLGAATFLAVGCAEILMGKDSVLCDFDYLPAADRPIARDMLLPIVREQGYPEAPFRAAIDPPSGKKGATIDPAAARQFQITTSPNVDTVDSLYATLGVEPDKVRVARDDVLDRIAEFFREPLVNMALVVLGIIGLILEMKLPGTTIPGTIAAICFVLFFWAYSYVGEFTTLAVLLFILGLIMIGVEIFVVPGFTFVGLAGILLVIGSMALVTLDRWPATSHEWVSLGGTLGKFGVSMVVAVIGAAVLIYYLPSIPYANKMVLTPPEESPPGERPTAVPARLLGAVGVSVTTLRPAGKGQFGDDFLDVVAEGDYVEPGKRLQIIEIEGNRIVVKEI